MRSAERGIQTTISESLPPLSTALWHHHHVLDLDDFTREEIEVVMDIADVMSEILQREVKRVPTLRGRTVVTMFYEPSTRTRASFELAAKSLSADTVSLDATRSSVAKGESLLDTLLTIQALGADIIVMRHQHSGAPYIAARHVKASIINAGDGWHAHPSQALLDIYTIRKHLGDLKDRKIAIIGDIMHSRVARSNIWGMTTMGAKVVLCGPPTLLSPGLKEFIAHCRPGQVTIETELENAIRDADVVMPLRLQIERQQSGLLPSLREYVQLYQINEEKLSIAKPHALVMHPGPMNEGIEISAGVARGAQSVIEEQVNNGVAVRMALLYLVAGGRGG